MIVLVTGSSSGIGKATALKFLNEGHFVYGFDKKKPTIEHPNFIPYKVDISDIETYPVLDKKINILINNAGVQNNEDDINVNLKGTIHITENYGLNPDIKSILFIASACARSGFEFPEYVASKAGVVGYMKNVAYRIAKDYKATCNSLSLGGVKTPLNAPVMEDDKYWEKIMDVTPLKKWMTPEEVADWIYFITMTNKSMTAQDILIDNGELSLNNTFVWPKE